MREETSIEIRARARHFRFTDLVQFCLSVLVVTLELAQNPSPAIASNRTTDLPRLSSGRFC